MKRMKKNPVEHILEWITGAEGVILLIAMSGMDSPDLTVPIVLTFQALAWLVIVGNRLDWGDYDEDEDRDTITYENLNYI